MAIAVTYAPESRLAETADLTLAFSYEDPGFGPGTISYIASLGALYSLGWRAKELAEGQSLRGCPWDTARVADATTETIELSGVLAEQLAASLPNDAKIDILGGGPSLGTALFGRAKLIESAHSPGGAHELEEWAHEEFFCTRPGVTTIVVAPPGPRTTAPSSSSRRRARSAPRRSPSPPALLPPISSSPSPLEHRRSCPRLPTASR